MRLIDADSFKKYLADGLRNTINEGIYTIDSLLKAERVTNDFMKDIDEQETVEAVPVRNGYWNHIHDHDADWGLMEYFMCSECEFVEFGKTDYCPHCGARMDGAAE